MPGGNCLLGICCPPREREAIAALAAEMSDNSADGKAAGLDHEHAAKAAKWILQHYDLMPLGSTDQLKAEIAKFARENP